MTREKHPGEDFVDYISLQNEDLKENDAYLTLVIL